MTENGWQLLQGKKQYDYLGKEERKAMLARVWDEQVSQSSIDELFLGNKSGQVSYRQRFEDYEDVDYQVTAH